MKRYEGELDFFLLKDLEHFVCKMQACRRASRASNIVGKNILITLAVRSIVRAPYVRGERNVPVFLKPIFRKRKIEFHRAEFSSFVLRIFQNRADARIGEFVAHSGLLFFRAFYERVPNAGRIIDFVQKDEFHFASRGFLRAENPRLAHPRIVEDHQSAAFDEIRQVAHRAMKDFAAFAPQDHEAVVSAPLARILRDEFRRQVKIKVRALQNKFLVSFSPESRCFFISTPKCLYALSVTVRPRGVRCKSPH